MSSSICQVEAIQLEAQKLLDILQLWTTKVNQLDISGTRFFGDNLNRTKGAQKWCFHVIPTHFGRAKILSKIFGLHQVYR